MDLGWNGKIKHCHTVSAGTLIKPENLADTLQVCIDRGAKKILLPIISAADMGTVPPELMGAFNIIFYSSAEDAVFKALGVEWCIA